MRILAEIYKVSFENMINTRNQSLSDLAISHDHSSYKRRAVLHNKGI